MPSRGKRHFELVVGAAVEVRGGDDVVAGLAESRQRQELRSLAARRGQGRHAPFEGSHSLFEDVGRRVLQAGVDVAEFFKGKEAGAVIGGVEGVGGRLVDRDRTCVGARSGLLAGVDLEGFKVVFVVLDGHCVVLHGSMVGGR